jgi:hypothetical protein
MARCPSVRLFSGDVVVVIATSEFESLASLGGNAIPFPADRSLLVVR